MSANDEFNKIPLSTLSEILTAVDQELINYAYSEGDRVKQLKFAAAECHVASALTIIEALR